VGSCRCADRHNKHLIFEHVQWLYDHAPHDCWGSEEAYRAWIKRGGLNGPRRDKESPEKAGANDI
jgi:hypothetical protein